MNNNWHLPYDHSGKWQSNIPSIFNPSSKITFYQLVAEMTLWNRESYLKGHIKLSRGPGWSKAISGQVRSLCQQSVVLCNYFPFILDEPLVCVAFKNFFRNTRCMKIGAFKKNRLNKKGNLNISQAEKDVVNGIRAELDKLIKQRDTFKNVVAKTIEKKANEEIKFQSGNNSGGKMNVGSLLSLEKKLFSINEKPN